MLVPANNSSLTLLNLSMVEENPKLDSLMDVDKLVWHIVAGNIRQVDHPDGETKLYTYTEECARKRLWDEVTTNCRGLICRGDRVLARPFAKFFQEGTKGLPETHWEEFPREMPIITEMLDGEQVVMFEGIHGQPCLANRYGFISKAIGWGTLVVRSNTEGHWPKGATPVFQLVGEKWRRIRKYEKPEIYLVGMVKKRDGSEMGWETVKEWAKWNEIKTVGEGKVERLEEIRDMESFFGRGWILRWDRVGAAPLRVILRDEGYEKLRNLVRTVTPLGIWDLMRQGAELDPLMQKDLPEEFVEWVKGVEKGLSGQVEQVGREAMGIWWGMKKNIPHDEMWGQMLRMTVERQHLRPMLVDMIYKRDWKERAWAVVRERVEKMGTWDGGR